MGACHEGQEVGEPPDRQGAVDVAGEHPRVGGAAEALDLVGQPLGYMYQVLQWMDRAPLIL
jgi:hypothetical protein